MKFLGHPISVRLVGGLVAFISAGIFVVFLRSGEAAFSAFSPTIRRDTVPKAYWIAMTFIGWMTLYGVLVALTPN